MTWSKKKSNEGVVRRGNYFLDYCCSKIMGQSFVGVLRWSTLCWLWLRTVYDTSPSIFIVSLRRSCRPSGPLPSSAEGSASFRVRELDRAFCVNLNRQIRTYRDCSRRRLRDTWLGPASRSLRSKKKKKCRGARLLGFVVRPSLPLAQAGLSSHGTAAPRRPSLFVSLPSLPPSRLLNYFQTQSHVVLALLRLAAS